MFSFIAFTVILVVSCIVLNEIANKIVDARTDQEAEYPRESQDDGYEFRPRQVEKRMSFENKSQKEKVELFSKHMGFSPKAGWLLIAITSVNIIGFLGLLYSLFERALFSLLAIDPGGFVLLSLSGVELRIKIFEAVCIAMTCAGFIRIWLPVYWIDLARFQGRDWREYARKGWSPPIRLIYRGLRTNILRRGNILVVAAIAMWFIEG